jgi:hypothetical protein
MTKLKTSKDQPSTSVIAIILALIGLIGTLGVAYFNYRTSVDELVIPVTFTELAKATSPINQTLSPSKTLETNNASVFTPSSTSTIIPESYVEDFSEGVKYWPIKEIDNEYATESRSLGNNAYIWKITAHKEVMATIVSDLPAASNFDLEIRIVQTSGNDNVYYGIQFRKSGYGYYSFLINGQGKYYFAKLIYPDQTSNYIIEPTKSSAIKANGVNTLRIIAQGNRIDLLVNQIPMSIGPLVDDSLKNGTINLLSWLHESESICVEVRNFSLTPK